MVRSASLDVSRMRQRNGSGKGTASSVPGGVFGAAPDLQNRDRCDGIGGGRGNSSSVVGGIFGAGPDTTQNRNVRAQPQPSTFQGAYGGRASNAGQLLTGCARGGQNNHSAPMSPPHADEFLDRLEDAERADAEHLQELAQQAAADEEMIADAAAQIAAEQGMSEEEEYDLYLQLRSKLQRSAVAPPPPTPPQSHAAPPAQQAYAAPPPSSHYRRPGDSPRISAKPTMTDPSFLMAGGAVGAKFSGAAGGYHRKTADEVEGYDQRRQMGGTFDPTKSSLPGGIFGHGGGGGGGSDAGMMMSTYGGARREVSATAWEGAAGGRAASNWQCQMYGESTAGGGRRNPNSSSIPGGIFG